MIEPAMGEFEGLPALRRFADELRDGRRSSRTGSGRSRFCYQVIERRGTGGGNFRLMYSRFLAEAGRDEAPDRRATPRPGGPTLAGSLLEASEAEAPTPALWSRIGERAAAVLEAEERLWPALARASSGALAQKPQHGALDPLAVDELAGIGAGDHPLQRAADRLAAVVTVEDARVDVGLAADGRRVREVGGDALRRRGRGRACGPSSPSPRCRWRRDRPRRARSRSRSGSPWRCSRRL